MSTKKLKKSFKGFQDKWMSSVFTSKAIPAGENVNGDNEKAVWIEELSEQQRQLKEVHANELLALKEVYETKTRLLEETYKSEMTALQHKFDETKANSESTIEELEKTNNELKAVLEQLEIEVAQNKILAEKERQINSEIRDRNVENKERQRTCSVLRTFWVYFAYKLRMLFFYFTCNFF